mgnify:CR=1 FL=1
MNTGQMPSVSTNMNVGAENKKVVYVDPTDLMTQSSSRSRGGRMDINGGAVQPMMQEGSKDN